ncbi:AraC family transcriptional regulator [Spongiibacter sp. KMU-166]|uniref:AraC family transcriptional regulator n=1 Tax=Spongiibacter thalassae TaxID=2721624 RepID=A0ABX1GJE8_9GAMM|nr:AraC family transcriptional regulator [Spongiibacter thalassae]NKI19296.1 AraC family transcriptional regulator [Spongiibacter thalassae]
MDNWGAISISVHTVQRCLVGARAHGLNCSKLLRSCGIAPDLLQHSSARIPLRQFIDLCRLISGRLGDEQYGLLERRQQIGSYHAIAVNAVHGATLGEAMTRFTRYSNLFDNSLYLHCVREKSTATLQVWRRSGMQVRSSLAIDIALMILHRFASWLINERIHLHSVKLDYPAEALHEHRYLFFNANVLHEQEISAVEFDAAYLDRPVAQNEQSLAHYFEDAPAKLYLPLSQSGPLSLEVRSLLESLNEEQFRHYTLRQACAELHTKPDTLRRHLANEGSSWQLIRNTLRREKATHLLTQSGSSIEQIAFAIGYTEAAAFIRAFKTWTGMTPLQYRKSISPR